MQLHLTALGDLDGELGSEVSVGIMGRETLDGPVVGSCRDVFYLSHRQQTFSDTAKDDVLPIEELGWGGGDEELQLAGKARHSGMIKPCKRMGGEKLT